MQDIFNKINKEFLRWYGAKPDLIASAPGRIDFLNTHQDYKGLPVVSIGINLRTYVAIKKREDNKYRILSLNLKEEGLDFFDEFETNKLGLIKGKWFGNYLRASLLALFEKGHELYGFDVLIYSKVPIAAGLASSAALTVSFIGSLNYFHRLDLSKHEIAELAYHAEHDIMGIACGRLDQYGSVYGGIVKIEMKEPYNVEELPKLAGKFVILDSGIRHSTADIHPVRQEEINQALKLLSQSSEIPEAIRENLGEDYFKTEWQKIDFNTLEPFLTKLPVIYRNRIIFTFKMQESTMKGLKIILNERNLEEKSRLRMIGDIMNYQHELLRDFYDLSLFELEKIREAALKAGALGVKLSGAGLGGSLVALVENEEKAIEVLQKSLQAGAKKGWIVSLDDGLRKET